MTGEQKGVSDREVKINMELRVRQGSEEEQEVEGETRK